MVATGAGGGGGGGGSFFGSGGGAMGAADSESRTCVGATAPFSEISFSNVNAGPMTR